jgi:phytoene dehydrogenase-like protein
VKSGRQKSTDARPEVDAIIVGSGPNGLAAAITLAREGLSVQVLEACQTIGGGTRTQELTLPGFRHDVCSAVHPLGLASPFFRSLPLSDYGLEWAQPEAAAAHPLEDGPAVILERSLQATADGLGKDGPAYRRLMAPMLENWQALLGDLLGPLPLPPRHPWLDLAFGLKAIRSAQGLAASLYQDLRARALFGGMAAHSIMPLGRPITAAFGLMMQLLGHAVGWPFVRGGSQQLAITLEAYLRSLGGCVETNRLVRSLDELPPARVVLLDVTPRQVIELAGDRLPAGYRRQLERYRYGPGVFKLDWALDGPIPWRDENVARAGTVHLGGDLEQVAAAEAMVWRGQHPERPFVLLAQQTLADPSRAPQGKHTAWAYCHVPNGSTEDMTAAIEGQVERYAPGFQDRILARSLKPPAAMQAHNANYIGGDINGGVQDIFQFFTRPVVRWDPYSTPLKGLFLCSSSTPPGGGVHGMCGYHAARSALRSL